MTFVIAYIRDYVQTYRYISESMETSVPWSKAHTIVKRIDDRLKSAAAKYGFAPETVFGSYRIT
jgi:hypothetical protein